jgi:hypothetical protein
MMRAARWKKRAKSGQVSVKNQLIADFPITGHRFSDARRGPSRKRRFWLHYATA